MNISLRVLFIGLGEVVSSKGIYAKKIIAYPGYDFLRGITYAVSFVCGIRCAELINYPYFLTGVIPLVGRWR